MSIELATINSTTLRTSKTGRILGHRMAFEGQLSAAEIRKSLKDSGLKGRELTKKVNAALTGSADIRWMKHDALQSAARSAGFIPDYADAAGNGKAMTVRYIAPASKGTDATALALKAKEAELEALKAELAKSLAERDEARVTAKSAVDRAAELEAAGK